MTLGTAMAAGHHYRKEMIGLTEHDRTRQLRTGQLKQDNLDRTSMIGQLGTTGKLGQNKCGRTARTV
jgi:hypothetical protein